MFEFFMISISILTLSLVIGLSAHIIGCIRRKNSNEYKPVYRFRSK